MMCGTAAMNRIGGTVRMTAHCDYIHTGAYTGAHKIKFLGFG